MQKQLNSIGEVPGTSEARSTFIACIESRSTAYQKMLAQDGDPEKRQRFREEVSEWRRKALEAAAGIYGAVVEATFSGGTLCVIGGGWVGVHGLVLLVSGRAYGLLHRESVNWLHLPSGRDAGGEGTSHQSIT